MVAPRPILARLRPSGLGGWVIDLLGVLSLPVSFWWIVTLVHDVGWSQLPRYLIGVPRFSLRMLVDGYFSYVALIHLIATASLIYAACWAFFKMRRLVQHHHVRETPANAAPQGLPASPSNDDATSSFSGSMKRITRPEFPSKWPQVFEDGSTMLVTGKHGTPWRFMMWNVIIWLLLVGYVCIAVIDAKTFGIIAKVMGAIFEHIGLLGFWHAKKIGIPIEVLVFTLPLMLLAPVASRRFRFYVLVHYFFRAKTTLKFSRSGVEVLSGSKSTQRLYRFDEGDITFRVVEHPKASYAENRDGKPQPFVEARRIEMIHGDRRVVIADIAWKSRAQDFATCCLWALRQVSAAPLSKTSGDGLRLE